MKVVYAQLSKPSLNQELRQPQQHLKLIHWSIDLILNVSYIFFILLSELAHFALQLIGSSFLKLTWQKRLIYVINTFGLKFKLSYFNKLLLLLLSWMTLNILKHSQEIILDTFQLLFNQNSDQTNLFKGKLIYFW